MQLLGGNRDLFGALEQPGEVLSGTYSFTSDLVFQDCGQDGASGSAYYINVIETRGYDQEEMGTVEYAHTFSITINSPTDYCITWVDNVYLGEVDTSYHGPDYGEPNEFDEENEYVATQEYYTMARYRDYGANAKIPDAIFDVVLSQIELGDEAYWYAARVPDVDDPLHAPNGANVRYRTAKQYLETHGYQNTPLHDLAAYLETHGPG